MPRLSAVGISGLQAGEDVKFMRLRLALGNWLYGLIRELVEAAILRAILRYHQQTLAMAGETEPPLAYEARDATVISMADHVLGHPNDGAQT